jgi:CubicO group peptidase (beta-lactamase class C family)
VTDVGDAINEVARETDFAGAVRVDRGGDIEFVGGFGLADRTNGMLNRADTMFGIASGTKGFTALAVVRLMQDGAITLDTTARSVLGSDLPLIDDRVTVEHLLSHTSGIGDYCDEESERPIDEPLSVSPASLLTTEGYLKVLDGHATKFAPGTRFSYCNGGYVVLALIAERASRTDFAQLVEEFVTKPAGMTDTAFLRSDALPHGAAHGYLAPAPSLQTNVFVLPARGSGDGGLYTTVADMWAFWSSFAAGRIVSEQWVREMTRPRHVYGKARTRYGLGFWLHPNREVFVLEGYDAGVSFRSAHEPATHTTCTVVSNDTEGAWPISRRVEAFLFP